MVELAVVRSPHEGAWIRFADPVHIVSCNDADEVSAALEKTERAVNQDGLTAVGFIAYEAAPAFDPAHRVGPASDSVPLLCFGLFAEPEVTRELPLHDSGSHTIGDWSASQSEADHRAAVERIRELIARGDTYQVNHTMRLRAPLDGDPQSLFRDLVRSQPESYAAYLELGDIAICSASPELFLELDGDRAVSRPMKGTADRGWDLASDRTAIHRLEQSEKDRAENAMIVDMVRNDLGRVAHTGAVEVSRRFEVERHPTVLQMTSTVEAKTDASIAEIIAAMFPYASITGAPRIRTTGIISELEREPRGIYTGIIGTIAPNRQARFSVAIRTAVVDRAAGTLEYGVGSGIVWDSSPDNEHRECRTKAQILTSPVPEFDLLETILWEPEAGYRLLDRHLERLAGAAEYFCRSVDLDDVMVALERRAAAFDDRRRVRLLVAADGTSRIEDHPIDEAGESKPVRLGLAAEPAQSRDPFLYFKTTRRDVYDRALASRPDCDDVLLWNERGEATESTIANLVARFDGRFVTPPTSSGLLAGVLRSDLIDRGEITEQLITLDDLQTADELFLINSVRGWRTVTLDYEGSVNPCRIAW